MVSATVPHGRFNLCFLDRNRYFLFTHTLVIITAFPQQQRLHERTSILRYTYSACLLEIQNTQNHVFNER